MPTVVHREAEVGSTPGIADLACSARSRTGWGAESAERNRTAPRRGKDGRASCAQHPKNLRAHTHQRLRVVRVPRRGAGHTHTDPSLWEVRARDCHWTCSYNTSPTLAIVAADVCRPARPATRRARQPIDTSMHHRGRRKPTPLPELLPSHRSERRPACGSSLFKTETTSTPNDRQLPAFLALGAVERRIRPLRPCPLCQR